jgi:hypothetical protein
MVRKALHHYMFDVDEKYRRHTLVLSDLDTGVDQFLLCSSPFTNGVFDYAEKLFNESELTVASIFHNLEDYSVHLVAHKATHN